MPTEKHLRAVLVNFLGTYTSRYSDLHGYWLFGFLVDQPAELRFDLLAEPEPTALDAVVIAAHGLAIDKFRDQLRKGGFTSTHIRTARLTIDRLAGVVESTVNGHACSGYCVRFRAEVVSRRGRHDVAERTVFVAPHDPTCERRSARADT